MAPNSPKKEPFETPEDCEMIVITQDEAGQRLDALLARRFSSKHSRSYFQMLIEEERVMVNGTSVKKRYEPKQGDEISIHFILTPEIGLDPEDIPLDIIYEDEHIIAVNKPAGMVVHPATGNWTGTFVNALLHHCQKLPENIDSALRPGIVHRLDKETSGILIAAKTSTAQQRLISLFASRQVYKEYIAICIGNPGDKEIEAPIGRHPIHRQQMAVVENGRPALSICKTLATGGKLSLVRVILATGRTHQIRVHLKHIGAPVLGDPLYGNLQANTKHSASRQLLHAYKLRFAHPITQKELELVAPMPADMNVWVKKLNAKQGN